MRVIAVPVSIMVISGVFLYWEQETDADIRSLFFFTAHLH